MDRITPHKVKSTKFGACAIRRIAPCFNLFGTLPLESVPFGMPVGDWFFE